MGAPNQLFGWETGGGGLAGPANTVNLLLISICRIDRDTKQPGALPARGWIPNMRFRGDKGTGYVSRAPTVRFFALARQH
jgi:hypothetical protein